MSLWQSLRQVDDQLGADDAPLWVEALGAVLVIGLLYRDAIHIFTALAADISPELDDHDVTLESPVVALRGHRFERGARVGACLFGVGAWMLLVDGAARPAWATAFVSANTAVLIGDPIAWALARARAMMHRDATTRSQPAD